MKQKFLVLLLMALMVLSVVAAAEGETLTVGPAETYTTIQAAIDYVAAQADPNGWTINVKNGEYGRFTVPVGMQGLSIVGESEDGVVVRVLDSADAVNNMVDHGGINVFGKNTTLKNMNIRAGKEKPSGWDSSAVSTLHGMVGGGNISLTMDSCTLTGPGIGKGAQYGIFFSCKGMNVKNCTISGFSNAIEFMNDGFNVPAGETYYFTGNKITGASFAIHGYMGGGNGGGVMLIADNTITGTDALRSKVIAQDNAGNSFVANVKDNKLENAVVGLVNLQDKGDIISDVLKSNTFGKNCFYVEAIEPGTIEFYSTYYSPSGQYGQWKLTGIDDFDVDWGHNPDGSTAFIQKVVDAANAEKSHTLSITGIDADQLIKSFTWFKDGIYWETLPEPTPESITPPKTGDNSTPVIWMALALLSVAGLMLLLRGYRKTYSN